MSKYKKWYECLRIQANDNNFEINFQKFALFVLLLDLFARIDIDTFI